MSQFNHLLKYVRSAMGGLLLCTLPTFAEGSFVIEAENEGVTHDIGRNAITGWSATVAEDTKGYLYKGAYTNDIQAGASNASFRMMVNDVVGDDTVATMEIHEANGNTILATRSIVKKDFIASGSYQDFTMNFVNPNNACVGLRLFWHGKASLILDKVFVRKSDEVLLLIRTDAMKDLKPKVDRYIADVESRFPVHITVNELNVSTALEVRQFIKEQYVQKQIKGVVLVGAMPMHRYYMHDFANPNPLYYEDFDLPFVDSDGDGVDDHYTGEPKLKIWVANLRTVTDPNDNGIATLTKLLDKVHDYYQGLQTIERRSMSVSGSDWPGSATWFAETVATPLFGNPGEVLEAPQGTTTDLLDHFSKRAYTIFRVLGHSNSTYTGIGVGGFSADEVMQIPNKSLITFNVGCSNANWLKTSAGSNNNALSWIVGDGIGQAVIGQVRSGSFYGEASAYKSLIAGDYLGNAYYAAKGAGEAEMYKGYPDGSVVAGNLFLGNPFLQIAPLTQIVAPIVTPKLVQPPPEPTSGIQKPREKMPESRMIWNGTSLMVNNQASGYKNISLFNMQGALVAPLFNGWMQSGLSSIRVGHLNPGHYIAVVKNGSGSRLNSMEFKYGR